MQEATLAVGNHVITIGAAAVERFWSKVDKSSGECWIWSSRLDACGYGVFKVAGVRARAHRIACALAGRLDAGLVVDHICHNRACVNPDHLRQVSNKQNLENQVRAHRGSATGVRGAYLAGTRYRTQVRHEGAKYSAGSFGDLAQAEAAVVALRNRLFTCNEADRAA